MRKTYGALLVAILLAFPLGCGHPTRTETLTVNPSEAGVVGVGVNGQVQFTALASIIDPGQTVNVTNQVAWTSSIPAVVTVNQQGLATSGNACGVSIITATLSGALVGQGGIVTGTATFTVADPSNADCPQSVPGL